jgi:heme exporter protein CcmD
MMQSPLMQWLNMGGYWPFVWPSYLLTLVVVILNVQFARRSLRDALSDARRRLQMKRSEP